MKKTAFAFISLLAFCLIIVACSKQAEVKKPAEKIPEATAETAPDTAMTDSTMEEGEGIIDSLTGEAKEAVDEAAEKAEEAGEKAAKEATGGH